jgi:hypothetical protein
MLLWVGLFHDLGWAANLGCVRFWDLLEWNVTIPFLQGVLAFGSGIKWNGTVPKKRIYRVDSECTRPAESAERGGTAA